MEEQQQQSIVDIISKIIEKNPDTAYLSKNVCQGIFHKEKGFLRKNDGIMLDTSSWIRVMKINKVIFNRFVNYRWNMNRYSTSSRRYKLPYLSIYNQNYRNKENYLYQGVNIAPEYKLKGYHYNICDIYKPENFNKTGMGWLDQLVYKLIYIGEKNFLCGFIDTDGILYIDNIILDKILKHSVKDFNTIINRIISVYANANILFFSLNTQSITEHVLEKISYHLVSRLYEHSKECTVIPFDHIDIFNDFNTVSELINRLKKEISNQITELSKESLWGVNDQYSFQKLITDIIKNKDENYKIEKEKIFMNGLVYGNKFELSGWSLSEENYDSSGVCWEKDVHIVPTTAFYKGIMYHINETEDWKNPFEITKLYVTSSGKMYCKGYHPNVSSGKVCMGDISGKISLTDVKHLQANLNRCEALLTSINYDSPYDSSRRDEIIEHSQIVNRSEFSNNNTNEFISDGTIIQDVVFEDDVIEDEYTKEDKLVEIDSTAEIDEGDSINPANDQILNEDNSSDVIDEDETSTAQNETEELI